MHDDCQAGGKVPCRGAVSVPREGRPPAGLAVRGGSPGPLRLWWQQEAIPVHLLPLGWPGWWAVAVTAGAGLLSVPPWGGGGFSLEAGPKGPGCPCRAPLPLLCLAAWPSGHSLQSPSFSQAALCEAHLGHGWRGRSSMETFLSTQAVVLAGDVMEGQQCK